MLAFNSPTDRMMARVAISIFTLGLLFGIYSVGQPLYWRFYATVIHPFDDPDVATPAADPFADMLSKAPKEQQEPQSKPAATGGGGAGSGGAGGGGEAVKPAVSPSPSPPPPAKVAPSTKYDPNHDYALTTELIDSLAQDGYLMVTWANEHYLDFAITWVSNLRKAGVEGYIVGAMDDDMLKSLADRGIHTWRMATGITKKDLGWGSANFHKMGRAKINLILKFLEITKVTVVISDIDTAWLRNPIPFFKRYPEADILTSTDQLGPTVQTEDLERWPQAGSSFNIGIMVFKPTSKAFVEEWVKVLEKPDVWDQSAFNDLARRAAAHGDAKGLFKGWDGKITVGILPASQFSSGHVFFVQRKYEEYKLQPYVAHATFQYSGTPGKRNRFREFMMFEDPPAYYDFPEGFITFKVEIPQALLDAADGSSIKGPMTADKLKVHFNLVHHQLLWIRAAIGLATLTGRALILPPIWCELDKYWAPLDNGNIPGSGWKKPFICPMDHVLDIENGWFANRPFEQFGPRVEWREYSFLQNPRLPAAVNNSRLVVEVCNTAEAGCADGSAPATPQDGKVKLAPGLDSSKLSKALEGLDSSKHKILDVRNIIKMWPTFTEEAGWFTDPKEHKRFVWRLKHMTSVSCCLHKQPGWVWYDFLWDVPHKDRHNRPYESWHVKLGDQDLRADAQQQRRRLLSLPATSGAAADPLLAVADMQSVME